MMCETGIGLARGEAGGGPDFTTGDWVVARRGLEAIDQ